MQTNGNIFADVHKLSEPWEEKLSKGLFYLNKIVFTEEQMLLQHPVMVNCEAPDTGE